MSLDTETAEVFKDFMSTLNDAERQRRLCSVSPSLLPRTEKMILRELYRHFWSFDSKKRGRQSTGDEDGDEDEESDGGADKEPRPRPKRQRADRNHPWKTFMDLQSLPLPVDIQQHLQENGTDPLCFLEDPHSLAHKIKLARTTGDAISDYYTFMIHLGSRAVMDATRWCFQLIAFYDMVKEISPESSGSRVGTRMKQEIVPVFENMFRNDQAKIDEALKNLQEWSNWGYRINHLCETFGTGCVFFLAKYLTANFLKNRWTATGDYHDEAFEHLKRLRLGELARESQIQDLGSNIREYLLRPFIDARIS